MCEHVDDSEIQHNEKVKRQECTSYNATCADDADMLLRHCLPEVFVNLSEVDDVIKRERKLALDKRFNMGTQRYSRFNDFDYIKRQCDKKHVCEHTQRERQKEDKQVIYSATSNPGNIRVSADTDPFDAWPTIRSEYPVMVRRPEDFTQLYAGGY